MVAITSAWGDVAGLRKVFREANAACFRALAIPHQHDAFEAPDGTFTIRNLPMFSVTVDARAAYGETPRDFDPPWLQEALAFHREQQARGYFAPIRVNHKGWGKATKYSGLFAADRIADYPDPETGELVPTLFGDMTQIPADIYREIERLQLPFRSVEIPRERYPGGPMRPGFSALCLLDEEEPYFHHEITRPRLVSMGAPSGTAMSRRYALASDTPSGQVLLFAFNPARFCCMDPTAAPPVAPPPAAPAPAAGPSALEQKIDRVLELLEAALGEPEQPEAPVSQPPAEGAQMGRQPAPKANGDGFVTVAQFAKLSAEHQATQRQLAERNTRDAINDRITSWKDRRLAFDEKRVRDEAAKFAAYGPSALKEYLDSSEATFAAFGVAPPTPTDPRIAPSPGTKVIDPKDPVLGQFAKNSPEVQAEAERIYASYKANPKLADLDPAEYVRGILRDELRTAAASESPDAAKFAREFNVLRMSRAAGVNGRKE